MEQTQTLTKERSPSSNPQKAVWKSDSPCTEIAYSLIYIGGALGVIHAAVMAQLGYKVLLVKRLLFGRMTSRVEHFSRQVSKHNRLGLIYPQRV